MLFRKVEKLSLAILQQYFWHFLVLVGGIGLLTFFFPLQSSFDKRNEFGLIFAAFWVGMNGLFLRMPSPIATVVWGVFAVGVWGIVRH